MDKSDDFRLVFELNEHLIPETRKLEIASKTARIAS